MNRDKEIRFFVVCKFGTVFEFNKRIICPSHINGITKCTKFFTELVRYLQNNLFFHKTVSDSSAVFSTMPWINDNNFFASVSRSYTDQWRKCGNQWRFLYLRFSNNRRCKRRSRFRSLYGEIDIKGRPFSDRFDSKTLRS